MKSCKMEIREIRAGPMTQNESLDLAEARGKLHHFEKLSPKAGHDPSNEECCESLKSLDDAVEILKDVLGEDDYSNPDKKIARNLICSYRRWAVKLCDTLGQEPSEYEVFYAFVVSFLKKLNVKCESNAELSSYERQFEKLKWCFSVTNDNQYKEIFIGTDYLSLFGIGTRSEYEKCKREEVAFRARLKESQDE